MPKVRGPTVKKLPWSSYDLKSIVRHNRRLAHCRTRLNGKMLLKRLNLLAAVQLRVFETKKERQP
jgi:hypothetical protein